MILVHKRLVALLSGGFAAAITLYPFILLREKSLLANESLLYHEKIHLRQQLELALIGFYVIYILEYLIARLRGMSHYKAYRNISFEKEAYANEKNSEYLREKKYGSFVKYLYN